MMPARIEGPHASVREGHDAVSNGDLARFGDRDGADKPGVGEERDVKRSLEHGQAGDRVLRKEPRPEPLERRPGWERARSEHPGRGEREGDAERDGG